MVMGLDLGLTGVSPLVILLIYALLIWTTVWKAIGLWHSAKNNQVSWFVVMIIFNTAGILPIIYLTWFQKKGKKKK